MGSCSSTLHYTVGILDWITDELKDMNRKTRKLMAINHAFHPKADVGKLYINRNAGGRGMVSVEESMRIKECGLSTYTKRTDVNEDSVFVKNKAAVEFKIIKQQRGLMDGNKSLYLVGTLGKWNNWKLTLGIG